MTNTELEKQLTANRLWDKLFTLLGIIFKSTDSKTFLFKCRSCSSLGRSIVFSTSDHEPAQFYCRSCSESNSKDDWITLTKLLTSFTEAKIVEAAKSVVNQHEAETKVATNNLSPKKLASLGIYPTAKVVKTTPAKTPRKAKPIKPKTKLLNEGEYATN